MRGIVVIASAYRTEDPWFDSSQGVRFLETYTYITVLIMHCHILYFRTYYFHNRINSAKALLHLVKSKVERVVDDFEDADKAEAHAQAEEAGRDRDEGEGGDGLVAAAVD
jgi:hypothetical protein